MILNEDSWIVNLIAVQRFACTDYATSVEIENSMLTSYSLFSRQLLLQLESCEPERHNPPLPLDFCLDSLPFTSLEWIHKDGNDNVDLPGQPRMFEYIGKVYWG